MDLDKAIDERRSIRDFKEKKVNWADVLEAIDAARKAPLSGNNCNIRFMIIENQEAKNKIAKLSEQYWIADASILVVVCSDDTSLENTYYDRGKVYARQQAGAAIENFLLKITDLGLASCWVGAYPDELIKQVLRIPEHINIEAILPIGYPKTKAKAIKKATLEKIINWEKWGDSRRPTRAKDPKTR